MRRFAALGVTTIALLTSLIALTAGPALAADLNVSLFPTSYLTLTNQTSLNDNRTTGDAVYSQFLIGQPISAVIPYTYLGIRDVSNSTGAEIRIRKWFAIHAAYQYSDRRISVVSNQENFGAPAPAPSWPCSHLISLPQPSYVYWISFSFVPADVALQLETVRGRDKSS